jgi:hypothetical protein
MGEMSDYARSRPGRPTMLSAGTANVGSEASIDSDGHDDSDGRDG